MSVVTKMTSTAAAVAVLAALPAAPTCAADNKPILTITVPEVPSAVAFSPDGKRLLTASNDGPARLWDATSGRQIAEFKEARTSAAFSPDGKRIVAVADGKSARLFDTASGKELAALTGHEQNVAFVAFSRDGKRIATASSDKTARIWDAASGKEVAVIKGHEGPVLTVVFNPKGDRVLTVASDKTMREWETGQGRMTKSLEYSEGFTAAVYSPDAKLIAAISSDQEVRLWDVALNSTPGSTLRGHSESITAVAYSPDGKLVATASADKSARLWNGANGRHVLALPEHGDGITAVAFSPDSKRVATAARDKMVRVFAAPSAAELSKPVRLPAGLAGLWHAKMADGLPPGAWEQICREMPGIIHPDGLIVVFYETDEKKLPVALQHMRCGVDLTCDVFEGAPKKEAQSLGIGQLSLEDDTAKFCAGGQCTTLARCPAINWSQQDRASGFSKAWDERVRKRE